MFHFIQLALFVDIIAHRVLVDSSQSAFHFENVFFPATFFFARFHFLSSNFAILIMVWVFYSTFFVLFHTYFYFSGFIVAGAWIGTNARYRNIEQQIESKHQALATSKDIELKLTTGREESNNILWITITCLWSNANTTADSPCNSHSHLYPDEILRNV